MAFGFNDGPQFGNIPTAVAWLAPMWNAGTTYAAGVGGVSVLASYVQYNGIVYSIPGTVASTPGTPPPGGVWVVSSNPDPNQSAFSYTGSGAGGFSSFAPATATDVPGCAFYIPDAQLLTAGSVTQQNYVPGPGRGLLTCSGAGLLQFNIAGTWTTVHTFTSTAALYIMADGLNVRYANTTVGSITFTFYKERNSKQ